MQPDNSRNTIIFGVCAALILIAYQFFVVMPDAARKKAEAARHPATATAAASQTAGTPAAAAAGVIYANRAQARGAAPRVQIRTEMMHGSLSLRGGRIDDLYLDRYRETVDANSPSVELLRPEGLIHAYFTQLGWANRDVPGMPGPNTLWTLASGDVLAPGKPVVLTYATPTNLRFTRTISVDDQYMFTVTDRVANLGTQQVTVRPYASVQRYGAARGVPNPIVHEGAIGFLDSKLKTIKYDKWSKQKEAVDIATRGGWLGITDKYWMTAIVPDQSHSGTGTFRTVDAGGTKLHEALYQDAPVTIRPGRQVEQTSRIFAGAKRYQILKAYEANSGAFAPRPAGTPAPQAGKIPQFDLGIDWGMFWFFTRPFFMVVDFLYGVLGNFGLAIIALTVAVKLLFFPLANAAFSSMAKIKKLQPKMEELKAKYADDQTRLQQETMALYQKEKINPLAGCLPIFIQIPVFYSLYKVLSVTIEMRHAPFYGWIHDLSAPDPTTFLNLFGLLPFDPGTIPVVGSLFVGLGFLHIGLWPLMYGLTMWLQTSMSPSSPDPTQQMIMRWFPVIFTVMLAKSPAGLVIYWAWSNLLTIVQQYIIMRRNKTENPIDGLIARFQGKEYKVEA